MNDKKIEITKDILRLTLPKYLQDDIAALENGYKTKSTLLDCLYCEVQASINVAFYDNAITEEEANFLRKEWL